MTPSNQTLILAGERAPPRGTDGAASTAVLQRVTVVATRPDDTLVYFRADYSSGSAYAGRDDADPADAARPQIAPGASSASNSSSTTLTRAGSVTGGSDTGNGEVSWVTPRDLYGNSRTANRGVEQYARTQRILAETQDPPYVDVLA